MKRSTLKRRGYLLQRTPMKKRSGKKRRTEREIDEAFLDFVRDQKCCVPGCDRYGEAHHLRTRAAGGSDYTCVPLCRQHHGEVHFVGVTKFQETNQVDLWEVNSELIARWEK